MNNGGQVNREKLTIINIILILQT